MARLLKHTFKGRSTCGVCVMFSNALLAADCLLTKPLFETFDTLPSPEQLKYKVLIRVGDLTQHFAAHLTILEPSVSQGKNTRRSEIRPK